MITESLQTSKHILSEEKFDKFPNIERQYYQYCRDTNGRDKSSPDLQYAVSCHDSSIVSSNGKKYNYCAVIFLYTFFIQDQSDRRIKYLISMLQCKLKMAFIANYKINSDIYISLFINLLLPDILNYISMYYFASLYGGTCSEWYSKW